MIRRYNYVIGNSQNDSKQNWSQDKYTPPKISIFPDWPTVQFLGEKFSKPVFMFQNNLSFKVIMFGPPGLSQFEAKNVILQTQEFLLYILMTVYCIFRDVFSLLVFISRVLFLNYVNKMIQIIFSSMKMFFASVSLRM